MFKKIIIAALFFILLGAGAFGYRIIFPEKYDKTPVKNEYSTIYSKLDMPEPLLCFKADNKKAAFSPVLFKEFVGQKSGAGEEYFVMMDSPVGIFNNIRNEMIIKSPEQSGANAGDKKKAPASKTKSGAAAAVKVKSDDVKQSKREKTFGLEWGTSLTLPEYPDIVNGTVFYSHTNGVIPLYLSAEWLHPGAAFLDFEKKLKAGKDFTLINKDSYKDGSVEMEVRSYRSKERDATFEFITRKDANKSICVKVDFYAVSKSDPIIRTHLEDINRGVMEQILAKGKISTGAFTWREISMVGDFRIADIQRAYGIDMLTLTDRYFPGTNTPILRSSIDMWKNIPVGWSCLMRKAEWEKISAKVIKDVCDRKALTDKQLSLGVVSRDGIMLKVKGVDMASENMSRRDLLRISIVDKDTDKRVLSLYEGFSTVNVEGIRKEQR